MLKGILFALSACFIWGLIFIVPQFMDGFSSFEVAVGRYAFYGLISCLIFFRAKMRGRCKYPAAIWKKALLFSILPTFAYYIFVVLSLRFASPAICALILGISPIAIAFLGNWKMKECSYKSLIPTSLLIAVGLIMINVPPLLTSESPATYLWGLACAALGLISWSLYVVINSRFLKNNQILRSDDWATLLGVGTAFWVVLFTAIPALFFSDWFEFEKYTTFDANLLQFLGGSAILGLLCSWVGGTLWNLASLHLPVSFAGQITIFETIFGLLFIYALEGNLPPLLECIGIVFLLAAIAYGIRQASKNYSSVGETKT